jgi:threonine dehydrogenase-like Zn-dependent dehydrogenase
MTNSGAADQRDARRDYIRESSRLNHADAAQDGASHKIDPKQLITHRFKLDKIIDAYDTFGAAAKTSRLS